MTGRHLLHLEHLDEGRPQFDVTCEGHDRLDCDAHSWWAGVGVELLCDDGVNPMPRNPAFPLPVAFVHPQHRTPGWGDDGPVVVYAPEDPDGS